MLAYVDLVQRKEKEIGCDVLTHQKWFVVSVVPYSLNLDETALQERSKLYRRNSLHNFVRVFEHVCCRERFDREFILKCGEDCIEASMQCIFA